MFQRSTGASLGKLRGLVEAAAVGFAVVHRGGLPRGLQVGFAGRGGAILQALEDVGDGGVDFRDVGVAEQAFLFELRQLGQGLGLDGAGLAREWRWALPDGTLRGGSKGPSQGPLFDLSGGRRAGDSQPLPLRTSRSQP